MHIHIYKYVYDEEEQQYTIGATERREGAQVDILRSMRPRMISLEAGKLNIGPAA
jgi:hypothetical protein